MQERAILLAIDGIWFFHLDVFSLQITRGAIFLCMPYSARKFALLRASRRRLPPSFHRIFFAILPILRLEWWARIHFGSPGSHHNVAIHGRGCHDCGYPRPPIRKGICAPGGSTWGVEWCHFFADHGETCDSCASTTHELWTFF